MIIYKDYDSLFEKFSILTVDGNMKDQEALNFLKPITTSELYGKLITEIVRLSKK